MSTSIRIERYPVEMLDVLEQACATRKPIPLPFKDTKEAKSERLRFYGLVRALEANKHTLIDQGVTRLEFKLIGPPKQENILQIGFPDFGALPAFYAAIAAKHAADHGEGEDDK